MYTELVDFMFGYDVENIANNYKIISWNCQQIYVRKVKQLYKKILMKNVHSVLYV